MNAPDVSKTRFKRATVELAARHGWSLEQEQGNLGLLIFVKADMQLNVYTTTGTVGTALDHPKWGRTQLFRRNVTHAVLEKLFQNPRLHTGKGYHGRYAVQIDKKMKNRPHSLTEICWCWPDVVDSVVKHRTILE